jgi:hypothetical protein
MEPGPFQPAQPEDRQAWSSGSARWVHHNPLIELQAERRTIQEFIPPRLVPVQLHTGAVERSRDVVHADRSDLLKMTRLDARPSNKLFLSDAELVRETRVEDRGKKG